MEESLNWIAAGAVCVAAAVGEGLLSGKNPRRTLEQLKQPRWSPPFAVWVAIGVFYYAASFYALATLLGADWRNWLVLSAVTLQLLILAANALSNLLLFKRCDLRAFHFIMYPYLAAVITLVALLSMVDGPAALAMALYGGYLLYALVWTRALWRMNAKS